MYAKLDALCQRDETLFSQLENLGLHCEWLIALFLIMDLVSGKFEEIEGKGPRIEVARIKEALKQIRCNLQINIIKKLAIELMAWDSEKEAIFFIKVLRVIKDYTLGEDPDTDPQDQVSYNSNSEHRSVLEMFFNQNATGELQIVIEFCQDC